MPRVISDDQLNGAEVIKRAYEPPPPKAKAPEKSDESLKLVVQLIERLPGMIASASRAPVVNVEPPDVRVSSPSVYVTAPEIKVPDVRVNVPEGKAPVVNVEPPDVHLTINRPKEWEFTVKRNEYGQITTINAKAI